MTTEHHTQRLDFGKNGYIEATRDDTDEIQDFRLKAFCPDGTLIRELRIVYNIQYDYSRRQKLKAGEIIYDSLGSIEGYGHLQWEYTQLTPPEGWVNPYPDNYEPVKPEGCDMFHHHGYEFTASLYENKLKALMNCYIRKDLDAWKKPDEITLLTNAHVVTHWHEVEFFEEAYASECERLAKHPFNPDEARQKRLEFLKTYSKVIGVTIPYDPRFID